MAIPGVIPIRGMTPPTPSVAIQPLRPPLVPRVRPVPVAARPWRVLLVPPTPGAPTRAFDVARWQTRMAIGTLVVLVLTTSGTLAATVAALRTPELFVRGAEFAALREQLTAVEDSLSLVSAALVVAERASADSLTDPPTLAARITSATSGLRRPSLLARARLRPGARSGADSPTNAAMEGLPVDGRIASGFSRARRHPLLNIIRPHLGLDISAPRGTRITAPAPGRVSFVGRRFAFGLVVEVRHADGMLTRYAHCRTALVKAGDVVKRGMTIATVGSSGLTSGPHLHYEMLHNGRQVDPLRFHLRQPVDSAALSSTPIEGAPVSPVSPTAHVDSALTPATLSPR